ncbi:MAG: EamA-like transporter family protein, partial [Frankiales bacterium]|nr:EamA-like transporter family protein [Frankiales bacterium]
MLAAPPTRSSLPAVALALAGVAGLAGAVQARVNGELRVALDDALLAAAVSFVGGLVLVGLVVLVRPASRAALGRVREVPVWQRAAGLGGALLIGV